MANLRVFGDLTEVTPLSESVEVLAGDTAAPQKPKKTTLGKIFDIISHNRIRERDVADCHPIGAVTNLSSSLQDINNKLVAATTTQQGFVRLTNNITSQAGSFSPSMLLSTKLDFCGTVYTEDTTSKDRRVIIPGIGNEDYSDVAGRIIAIKSKYTMKINEPQTLRINLAVIKSLLLPVSEGFWGANQDISVIAENQIYYVYFATATSDPIVLPASFFVGDNVINAKINLTRKFVETSNVSARTVQVQTNIAAQTTASLIAEGFPVTLESRYTTPNNQTQSLVIKVIGAGGTNVNFGPYPLTFFLNGAWTNQTTATTLYAGQYYIVRFSVADNVFFVQRLS